MEVDRSHTLVVGGGMLFGKVIRKIATSGGPVDVELALFDPVSDPIEPHVHGFRADLFYSLMYDSECCGIVGLYRGGRLGVAHLHKGSAKWDSFFGIEEQSANLGFSCG